MLKDRKIGEYTGQESGPLLICFAAMHGNEPAGVLALERMFDLLEKEPASNPEFIYKGRIVGLLGNRQAYNQNLRFLKKDLNRHFKKNIVKRVFETDKSLLTAEDLELRELIETVRQEIHAYPTNRVYFLDLHTTSSRGGIFTITTDDEESVQLAIGLHAPVIKGFLKGIKGTSLHYFNSETMGKHTTALTFESGQHSEPLSVNRAIAAITNYMRAIGSVQAEHVENKHDSILQEYAKNLPKVAKLIRRHGIKQKDQFKMQPDFLNFQLLKIGDIIAYDRRGPIQIEEECLILMPLYQDQGEEGFFLIKEEL